MKIKEFIEASIEGGFKILNEVPTSFEIYEPHSAENKFTFTDGKFTYRTTAEILLDPKSWKSVGNVSGWSQSIRWDGERTTDAHRRAHVFLTNLFDGKTLESALEEATS